jgi:hypothetical protein
VELGRKLAIGKRKKNEGSKRRTEQPATGKMGGDGSSGEWVEREGAGRRMEAGRKKRTRKEGKEPFVGSRELRIMLPGTM